MEKNTVRIPTYLLLRNNTFYYRRRIPSHLSRYFTVSQIRFSLRVSSVRTAQKLAAKIHYRLEQFLSYLCQITDGRGDPKETKSPGMKNLTENEIQHLVTKFYQSTKREVEENWLHREFADENAFLAEMEAHDAVFNSLGTDLLCNRVGDFSKTVLEFLTSKGVEDVSEDSLQFKKLTRDFYAVSLQATKDVFAQLVDPSSKARHYLQQGPLSAEFSDIPPEDQSTTVEYKLSQAIQDYVRESKTLGNWTLKTQNETVANLELLAEILGPDISVAKITRKQLVQYKDTLLKFPTNRKKDRRYKNKSVQQILKMQNVKPMSPNTVNNYLVRAVGFFTWLRKRDEISENPAEGLTIKTGKNPRDYRAPFSKDELVGMIKELRLDPEFPERFWVPLLGLYTGARLNEICQLDLVDVANVESVWCISINADGDPKKSVKNQYGRRDIPIHENLIKLGFLEYVNERKATGAYKLWNLKFDAKEGYKRAISRWFNVQFKPTFIKATTKGKKDFHSLRHTVINYLMTKNVEEPLVASIVGQHIDTITFGRYGKGYPVGTLKKAIDQLDYYGINCKRRDLI